MEHGGRGLKHKLNQPLKAYVFRGDDLVLVYVVEKSRVDQLVARLRDANAIEGREESQAAITRLMDEFEGKP